MRLGDKHEWQVVEYNDGFKVTVPSKSGSSKDVIISLFDDPESGELWARYIGDAGAAQLLDPEFCLKLNGEDRFATGHLALRKSRLVFQDTQLVAEADEAEMRASVRNVAKFAIALTKLGEEARIGQGTGKFVRHRRLTDTFKREG